MKFRQSKIQLINKLAYKNALVSVWTKSDQAWKLKMLTTGEGNKSTLRICDLQYLVESSQVRRAVYHKQNRILAALLSQIKKRAMPR